MVIIRKSFFSSSISKNVYYFSEKSQRLLNKLPPLQFSSKLLGDSFPAFPMDTEIAKNYKLMLKVKILGALIYLAMCFVLLESVLGTAICLLAYYSLLKIMPGRK